MKYYNLQSCDETKYPSIKNLYWGDTHPYEGLFVYIDEIFQGESIDESKKYQLISTSVNVTSSNVPKLIISEFQSCNSLNRYLYKNCKTGQFKIFAFSLHPPLRNSLKINGDCEVWEMQHKIEDRAIRVRREIDDAEIDITFKNNILDVDTLINFSGGLSNCFITTWYDQSGNGNHATQTVYADQPKIFDLVTGEVTKENGKTAMVFDGAGDNLEMSSVAGKSNIDAYFVNKHDNTSTTSISKNSYLYPSSNGTSHFGFIAGENSLSGFTKLNYGSASLYKNNVLLSDLTRGDIYNLIGQTQNIINHNEADTSGWDSFQYGKYDDNSGLYHFQGTLQEIIIYDTNLLNSQREILHDNIKEYYYNQNLNSDTTIYFDNLIVAYSFRRLFKYDFNEVILYKNFTECDNCDDLNIVLCKNGERTIGTAVAVELPKASPPDRGFDKCCYKNIVLADYSDSSPYKNDFNGFFFKRFCPNSTIEFILVRVSDSSEYNLNDGTYGIFMPFNQHQVDLSYYIVEWRKVLTILGTGCYQVKKEITIAGITFNIISNTFNLQEFSIESADQTVRFDSYMDGKLIHIDTDFSNSGYKSSLRVPGFFGRADYSFEEDTISQRDFRMIQNTMNRTTEYEYQAEELPESITSELWDFLLFGDEIQISDYNKNNHSYKYDRISVKLENNTGSEFSTFSRSTTLNLTFSNRTEKNRKIKC